MKSEYNTMAFPSGIFSLSKANIRSQIKLVPKRNQWNGPKTIEIPLGI